MRAYFKSSLTLTLLLSVGSAATLNAADIWFVPDNGMWNVPGNWDLGRCPLPGDRVNIQASTGVNKAVTYNWTGASDFDRVFIDGASGATTNFAYNTNHLTATDVLIGDDGPAWYSIEYGASLTATDHLYVGYQDPGPGHFYMYCADNVGVTAADCYVGYLGPGDFEQINGTADYEHLFVGQNDVGEYWLTGSETDCTIDIDYYAVIGNADEGTFEQTGGTLNISPSGNGFLSLGLNPGGYGTYLMKGGALNVDHISIAYVGDGFFTQSGGTVTTTNDINIGVYDQNPLRAWYKLNEDDGPATLDVGRDLNVGEVSLAKYEQTAGTATVGRNLEIFDGDPNNEFAESYVYLGLNAGRLNVLGEVINHSGYYDQDGGILSTSTFTNDSESGVYLDNSADFRATNLEHNAGVFFMFRNAHMRGTLAIPPNIFFACNFTNNDIFQMGSTVADGGEFDGTLTNNGTFYYYQGDFDSSTLINNGTFSNWNGFTCNRLIINANVFLTPTKPITVLGAGVTNAVENNDDLTLNPGSVLTLGAGKTLLNNGRMYAGGSIADNTRVIGNLVHNDYLLPAIGATPGMLRIDGSYTQNSGADLRIRLGGTDPVVDYDQVRVYGHADLGGRLDVRLINGFIPSIGDAFAVVKYTSFGGAFNPIDLPTLPAGRYWRVSYLPTMVELKVVDEQFATGDMNCDGAVNFGDIDPFVLAITDAVGYAAQYPDCDRQLADINGDGGVNFGDIDPFVALITGG